MRVRSVLLSLVALAGVVVTSQFLVQPAQAGPPDIGIDDHEAITGQDWWYFEGEHEVSVYWYDGSLIPVVDPSTQEAQEAESDLAWDLQEEVLQALWDWEYWLDTDIYFPIHIYIYADWETMVQDSGFDRADIPPGDGFIWGTDLDTIYISTGGGRDAAEDDWHWPYDIIRHELGHLVLGEAAWSAASKEYRFIPLWLHEGVAQLGQAYTLDWFSDVDLAAYRTWAAGNQLNPVCDMLGYPDGGVTARDHFYNKSLVVVSLLLMEGGTDKLNDFIGRLQRGWAIRYAMNGTYGFTDHELEQRWLNMVGLEQTAERCTY